MTVSVVVDASVATAWVLHEPIAAAAKALLQSGETLIAPDLVISEVGHALWKAESRGDALPEQTRTAPDVLVAAIASLHPTLPLLPVASALARELAHPIYDCFYLALALREAADLVTADARMAKLGASKGIAVRLIAAPQPSSFA